MRSVDEETWIHGKYKTAILWFVAASSAGLAALLARNVLLFLGALAFAGVAAAQLAGARRALGEGLALNGRVIDAEEPGR